MTRIKLCGLTRPEDIEAANALRPEFVGFVFARKSKRRVNRGQARALRDILDPAIPAVGVFVNETPEDVADLLEAGVIDFAQLHGTEDAAYIARLRSLTDKPLIQAFRIQTSWDVKRGAMSDADHLLLDAGAGTGTTFDWALLRGFGRPYFLAGGLDPHNVAQALRTLAPWGVDVSSGIETDGRKDPAKMRAFVEAVRSI